MLFHDVIECEFSEFCTEFSRKYTKNEILRNGKGHIDSSLSWFNDYFVFLIYLEIFFIIFVLVNRFIFVNNFVVDQLVYIWK